LGRYGSCINEKLTLKRQNGKICGRVRTFKKKSRKRVKKVSARLRADSQSVKKNREYLSNLISQVLKG
jgi:hypothetical protein